MKQCPGCDSALHVSKLRCDVSCIKLKLIYTHTACVGMLRACTSYAAWRLPHCQTLNIITIT